MKCKENIVRICDGMKRMPRPTSPYGFLTWLCRQQVATASELALETPQVEIPTDWLGQQVETNPFVQFQETLKT
jgi:hypothetical protein